MDARLGELEWNLQQEQELRQAAETLSRSPASLQLRYLQTLLELGADQNSTVVFPLPIDIIGPFVDRLPHLVDRFRADGNGTARPPAPPAGDTRRADESG